MQFPNPIIRSLILYDTSGNAVIILGPGPFIKIINPTSGAELDLDAGTTFPEAVFWNSAHTDFGKISLEVSQFSGNQMLLIRSPAETATALPGTPQVQMRMFMTSFLQLGNVIPPNTNNGVGGQLTLDADLWALGMLNPASNDVNYIRSIGQNGALQDIQISTPRYTVIAPPDPATTQGVVINAFTGEIQAWNAGAVLDWVNLTLQNGWGAAAGYYTPAYRFTPTGQIELRGVMTGGANADNTVICLMPIVPAKLGLIQPALETGGSVNSRLFYNTDAKLYCYGCVGAGKIGLDGMRFSYK
jgi:hypothetical protein